METRQFVAMPSGGPPPEEVRWAARLVGAGSLLTLLYQIAYLILDRPFLSLARPWVLIFHLVNIGLFAAAVIMTLKIGPWMRRHWKQVALAFSTIMIASTTGIAVLTSQTRPLFIALMLFLAGTGPFLSWGEMFQTLLSIVAFTAFGVTIVALPDRALDAYPILGILIAAAIGLFSTALERRLRRARWRAEEEVLKSREKLLVQERMHLAGQLASGIAHDLNNTLNVIKLRLAALSEEEGVSQKHSARLAGLDHAIEHAARTVARVRELGKSRDQNCDQPVQLGEILGQAIELARSSIEVRPVPNAESIRISSRLPDHLLVMAPASDLRQVFLNLLLNAADAISNDGEIWIDSAIEDNGVLVRVSDNGTGIAPENIERVFEPFFTTKGPSGTGLGLSSARQIMEGIGGSITAANRANGGSVFVLKFPLAKALAQVPPSQPSADAIQRCRFLLIDDDAENVNSLGEILVRAGHHVDTALSGAKAIETLHTGLPYDIVLCDLGMPGMNGWEVARRAREIMHGVNFYIVTGWGREIEREIPSSVTVSGVVSKPIDLNQIWQIVAKVQACRQHERE